LMAGSGRKNADEALAAALAGGRTVSEAATAAGVSPRTAYRRLQDAAFQARVRAIRDEMVGAAAGRLSEAMASAALVLRNLLVSSNESVKCRAATRIIELGLKVTELHELEQRVAELERQRARR